jgi:hypothetical protein
MPRPRLPVPPDFEPLFRQGMSIRAIALRLGMRLVTAKTTADRLGLVSAHAAKMRKNKRRSLIAAAACRRFGPLTAADMQSADARAMIPRLARGEVF